jgi:hypothetical protein
VFGAGACFFGWKVYREGPKALLCAQDEDEECDGELDDSDASGEEDELLLGGSREGGAGRRIAGNIADRDAQAQDRRALVQLESPERRRRAARMMADAAILMRMEEGDNRNIGPEVGIEKFTKNLIKNLREFWRRLHLF